MASPRYSRLFPPRHLLQVLGVDRAVALTLLGRGWSAIAGVVNVVFIVRFLDGAQQGFYYTFFSILATQVFFELGLAQVVLQFSSHEKARLDWSPGGLLVGDADAKDRVASLVSWALRWYAVAGLLMVLVVLPAGWLFLRDNDATGTAVAWQLPWVVCGVTTALSLLLNPFLSSLEGCGKVARVSLIRLTQALALSAALWSALALGFGLFAASLAIVAQVIAVALWIALRYRAVFADLLRDRRRAAKLHWRTEVWPFQWRTAAMVGSAFFTFYFFTPVMFAYHGAVAAGQVGLSVSVGVAISSFASSWIYTKMSPYGVLVATERWGELDASWRRTTLQSTAVCVALCLGALGVLLALGEIAPSVAQRFVAPVPFAMLLAAVVATHLSYCQSYYLRAHKREPFVWISMLSGALIALSAVLLGRAFGAAGMMAGYLVVSLTLRLGAGTVIFESKRREWHETPSADVAGSP